MAGQDSSSDKRRGATKRLPAGRAAITTSPPAARRMTNLPPRTMRGTTRPGRGEKRAKAWTRHRDRERRAVAAQRDDWRQWQQDSRQWQQRSVMRTRDARYDGAREFVDQDGVRHIILPRRWRDRDDGDMAFDRPAQGRRPIVVRPSGLFGLFGDDGYGD